MSNQTDRDRVNQAIEFNAMSSLNLWATGTRSTIFKWVKHQITD